MALNAALSINTKAIECLQMGQQTEALALYGTIVGTTHAVELAAAQSSPNQSEMSMIRDDVDHADNEGEEIIENINHGQGATPNMSNRLPTASLFLVWSVSMDEFLDEVPRPSDDVFALFHRPFDIQISKPGTTSEESLSAVVPPIIFMYNMGFTYHTMASFNQDSVDSDASYREALECYQWSDYRVQEHTEANAGSFNEEMDLFNLSLLNNLGHCCAMLQRTEQAWSCWDRLQIQWTSTEQKHYLSEVDRAFFEARMAWGRRMKVQQYLTA